MLLSQLSQGLSRRLTVLVAPAGFGKTTLLAAWHAALWQQGTACAWVTLERDDDLYPVSYTHLDVYKRQQWYCQLD